jgi:small conductance mechanosensitive channel
VRPAQQWLVARSLRVAAHAALLDAGVVLASSTVPYDENAQSETGSA